MFTERTAEIDTTTDTLVRTKDDARKAPKKVPQSGSRLSKAEVLNRQRQRINFDRRVAELEPVLVALVKAYHESVSAKWRARNKLDGAMKRIDPALRVPSMWLNLDDTLSRTAKNVMEGHLAAFERGDGTPVAKWYANELGKWVRFVQRRTRAGERKATKAIAPLKKLRIQLAEAERAEAEALEKVRQYKTSTLEGAHLKGGYLLGMKGDEGLLTLLGIVRDLVFSGSVATVPASRRIRDQTADTVLLGLWKEIQADAREFNEHPPEGNAEFDRVGDALSKKEQRMVRMTPKTREGLIAMMGLFSSLEGHWEGNDKFKGFTHVDGGKVYKKIVEGIEAGL